MSTQTEAILEDKLIKQLTGLGYKYANIHNEEDDLESIKVTIDKKWQNFLVKDMIEIDNFINNNWQLL